MLRIRPPVFMRGGRGRPRDSVSRSAVRRFTTHQGRDPWILVFLGLWGAEFRFLPRWYFPQARSPAYPFFRKEKSVLRESDHMRDRGQEVCTDFLPPKFTGSKGI